MKIKLFTIPNILTLCNLLSGCAAAVFALCVNDLQWAFWCVVVAAVFDFLDGFVARLLKSHSAIGKELDSLADCISFGMAPAAVLLNVYYAAGGEGLWGYSVFVLAAFSALRLATFNIDENQTTQFIGLPSPASALLVAASGYLVGTGQYAVGPWFAVGLAAVLSYLLVCNVPMFALKFKHYGFRGNEVRYIFAVCALLSLAIWHIVAIPFIIVAYVAVSLAVRAACFRKS